MERGLAGRLEALGHLGEAIAEHSDEIVAALTVDTARSAIPAIEVHALADFIQRALSDAPQALSPAPPRPAQIPLIHGSTNRLPFGLVGNISPWNFPVILSFIDTFPALAAGNAVVIKPSEVTPRWVEPMRAAIAACPEIAAVLDIVPGTGQIGAVISQNVDAVVFTGSVPTGRKVAEVAAQNFIPAFLELGGKDPAVVLASADVELAAKTITFCSVQSTGQACQSLERTYVAREHYDRFVELAVQTAEALPINYPDIKEGVIGPFIFEQQAFKVREQIEDALAKGATVLCGGELIDHGGLWMRPTVVTGVTHDMLLMQEETFGPVVPIMAFDSEAEAVQLANDSQYGLSASVFAGDIDEGRRFAARINAGAVSVNDAALTAMLHDFEHDAFGFSGLGRSRAGLSAFTRFTREQTVMANIEAKPLLLNQLG
jgi:acyl-CoA reductase-like NAD-dependent aldehyde dehydrogenase